MNCPHCLKVIDYLTKTDQNPQNMRLVSIDTDHTSQLQLSLFLKEVDSSSTPFALLRNIKEKKSIEEMPVDNDLKTKAKNSLNFLSNLGITSIPVLISEHQNDEKSIFIGTDKIISHLILTSNR